MVSTAWKTIEFHQKNMGLFWLATPVVSVKPLSHVLFSQRNDFNILNSKKYRIEIMEERKFVVEFEMQVRPLQRRDVIKMRLIPTNSLGCFVEEASDSGGGKFSTSPEYNDGLSRSAIWFPWFFSFLNRFGRADVLATKFVKRNWSTSLIHLEI